MALCDEVSITDYTLFIISDFVEARNTFCE